MTPNPSKAPWYFVGLQELLVYFDPWIAGVMIPGLIIAGLMAVPYLDPNPMGIGAYSLRKRPFANVLFLLGIAMWFILIFIGYYCRGPNYGWYWPWESWLVHKPLPPPMPSLSVWVGGLLLAAYLGFGILGPRLIQREIPWKKAIPGFFLAVVVFGGAGILLEALTPGRLAWLVFFLFVYFFFGFLMPQRYIRSLPWPRYLVTMLLVLLTVGVLLKMGVRLGFNVKYIFTLPEYNFNI